MSEHVCCICTRSAVGRALDGKFYCEQRSCFSWKEERLRAQAIRDAQANDIIRAHREGRVA
jgi:hypothetical protein